MKARERDNVGAERGARKRSALRAPRSALGARRFALRAPRPRRGYTLLELTLVLALLVVVGAIIYPSTEAMYDNFRFTRGADAVRAAWASARAHAIDEGRPYRFSIIPNQGNFRVAPDGPEFWSKTAPAASDPASAAPVLSGTLPKGMRFTAPDASPAGQNPKGPSSLPAGSITPEMWSSRAVFLPDGTAREDLEIIFGAEGTRGLIMKLRALTGAVTVRSTVLGRARP